MTHTPLDALLRLFISGDALYVGLGAVVIACALWVPSPKKWRGGVASVLALLGGVLVILSAAPLAPWVYAVWCVLLAQGMLVAGSSKRGRRTRLAAVALLVAGSIAMALLELPYRRGPGVVLPRSGSLCVIGDSLCIGSDKQEQNWPELLAARADLAIHNHSFGGAKVGSARHNAKRVPAGTDFVIIEVSGNDLLAGTKRASYEAQLDELLSTVAERADQVCLVETPLPPFHNRYGRVQRTLAKKHESPLLPKRYLAGVLAAEGATTDGLHLSVRGHKLLAETFWRVLRPQ